MDDVRTPVQRIERLTPLADVLTAIDRQVTPIAPTQVDPASARGRVLAHDIDADQRPPVALALRDGYALRSEETADAGSYASAPLSLAVRVEVGEPVPRGADAVAPLDAVADDGTTPQAVAPIAPGEGVLLPGQDCDGAQPVLQAGCVLRSLDLAVLSGLGVSRVPVRIPALRIVQTRRNDDVAHAISAMLADLVGCHASAELSPDGAEAALQDPQDADGVIVVGGSGAGTNDHSVRALAGAGRVVAHGIGLNPGETSAFGFIEHTPVLVIPGRLDAALAVWHVLGARIMARLSGCTDTPAVRHAKLARKIASTIGLVEFVPVAAEADMVTPLASGYLPWRVLAQATGYVLVPAQQEGFAPGALVPVNPL
ncbi:MAG: molybdopterin-binding protein [Xanthobacteraceae bacterium]|nr:molybdopterin-binding protein [Xanthobacteraceae bacterium]